MTPHEHWTAAIAVACLLVGTTEPCLAQDAPPATQVLAEAPPQVDVDQPASTGHATANTRDETAKALVKAAAALEKSSEALTKAGDSISGAAKKLGEKEEEKTLVSGFVGGGRMGWNGLLFVFKEKEKKATASASMPFNGGTWVLGGAVTAPLDSETRIAALVDSRQRFKPFEGKLSLEYNAMSAYLQSWMKNTSWPVDDCEGFKAEWTEAQGQKPKDERERIPRCPGDEYDKWRGQQIQRQQQIKSVASAGPVDGASERTVPIGVSWTLGGEVKFGFDRQDVYVDDVAAKAQSRTASELQVVAVLRLYPSRWLAIPIRLGGGFDDSFKTKKASRCTLLASSETSVTAKACEDVLFLSRDSKTVGAGMIEVAAVAVVPDIVAAMAPGIEVRDRLEQLGSTRLNRLSIAMFATPTAKPIVTRFGVGFEHNWALTDAEGNNPDFRKGDRWVVPFLLAGGSL